MVTYMYISHIDIGVDPPGALRTRLDPEREPNNSWNPKVQYVPPGRCDAIMRSSHHHESPIADAPAARLSSCGRRQPGGERRTSRWRVGPGSPARRAPVAGAVWTPLMIPFMRPASRPSSEHENCSVVQMSWVPRPPPSSPSLGAHRNMHLHL
jgi:hypothetical protein